MLRRALESVASMRLPATLAWELLVVNNNCSDDTDAVLDSFAGRLPLRRLVEPEPGLSNARNRAIAESRGEWMVWTDDDVLVDPGWLAGYLDAFARRPTAAVFGGPIEPMFAEPAPEWLVRGWRSVEPAFSVRDLGDGELAFTPSVVPYGANYAVRRDVQAAHRYDPRLGRRPDSALGGEEVAVIRSVLAAGESGWWVPAARVRHVITRDRQTVRYLRRYFVGQGVLGAEELLPREGARPPRTVFGRPRWRVWRAMLLECRYRFARLVTPPPVWLAALVRSSILWGQLRGYPAAARAAGRAA